MTGIGNGPKIVFEIGTAVHRNGGDGLAYYSCGADTVLVAHTRFEKSA